MITTTTKSAELGNLLEEEKDGKKKLTKKQQQLQTGIREVCLSLRSFQQIQPSTSEPLNSLKHHEIFEEQIQKLKEEIHTKKRQLDTEVTEGKRLKRTKTETEKGIKSNSLVHQLYQNLTGLSISQDANSNNLFHCQLSLPRSRARSSSSSSSSSSSTNSNIPTSWSFDLRIDETKNEILYNPINVNAIVNANANVNVNATSTTNDTNKKKEETRQEIPDYMREPIVFSKSQAHIFLYKVIYYLHQNHHGVKLST